MLYIQPLSDHPSRYYFVSNHDCTQWHSRLEQRVVHNTDYTCGLPKNSSVQNSSQSITSKTIESQTGLSSSAQDRSAWNPPTGMAGNGSIQILHCHPNLDVLSLKWKRWSQRHPHITHRKSTRGNSLQEDPTPSPHNLWQSNLQF
jgi:hypothetical protein